MRVALENPGGAGKVWMTRELEVTPNKRYAVEVSFDLGTADHGTTRAWGLGVGVHPLAPTSHAALDFSSNTASGSETATGPVWAEKRASLTAQADDKGRLFVSLGVWGSSAGTRTYWIDNLRLVLTRV